MIVVTGANGFIGSVLAKDLNKEGLNNLLCVDTVTLEERSELLKNVNYDLFLHSEEFLNNINEHPIQAIFHIGACSSTTETDEDFLKRNNTEYTKTLFKYCCEKNIPFIYASSAAVYGDGENGFEDTKPSKGYSALNLYGWSKLKFDIWAEEQNKFPPKWFGFRFFNVYGPNEYHKDNMASVVFKAFNQISETNRLKLFKSHKPEYKDGEQLRDFVYVKDVSRWMIEAYKSPKIENGIYNMGFGTERSWLNLAQSVFDSLDKPLDIDWIEIPESIRDQYQYFTKANMNKLTSQGLSQPQWSLEKGISDYVKNYLKKESPYYE